jgi:hypothetical protein
MKKFKIKTLLLLLAVSAPKSSAMEGTEEEHKRNASLQESPDPTDVMAQQAEHLIQQANQSAIIEELAALSIQENELLQDPYNFRSFTKDIDLPQCDPIVRGFHLQHLADLHFQAATKSTYLGSKAAGFFKAGSLYTEAAEIHKDFFPETLHLLRMFKNAIDSFYLRDKHTKLIGTNDENETFATILMVKVFAAVEELMFGSKDFVGVTKLHQDLVKKAQKENTPESWAEAQEGLEIFLSLPMPPDNISRHLLQDDRLSPEEKEIQRDNFIQSIEYGAIVNENPVLKAKLHEKTAALIYSFSDHITNYKAYHLDRAAWNYHQSGKAYQEAAATEQDPALKQDYENQAIEQFLTEFSVRDDEAQNSSPDGKPYALSAIEDMKDALFRAVNASQNPAIKNKLRAWAQQFKNNPESALEIRQKMAQENTRGQLNQDEEIKQGSIQNQDVVEKINELAINDDEDTSGQPGQDEEIKQESRPNHLERVTQMSIHNDQNQNTRSESLEDEEFRQSSRPKPYVESNRILFPGLANKELSLIAEQIIREQAEKYKKNPESALEMRSQMAQEDASGQPGQDEEINQSSRQKPSE